MFGCVGYVCVYVAAEMFTLLAIKFLIKLKCCQTLHSASSSCSRAGVGRGRGRGHCRVTVGVTARLCRRSGEVEESHV